MLCCMNKHKIYWSTTMCKLKQILNADDNSAKIFKNLLWRLNTYTSARSLCDTPWITTWTVSNVLYSGVPISVKSSGDIWARPTSLMWPWSQVMEGSFLATNSFLHLAQHSSNLSWRARIASALGEADFPNVSFISIYKMQKISWAVWIWRHV